MNEWGEKIEMMLAGELNQDETTRLEQELQRSPELRKEKQLRIFVDEVLSDVEMISFRQNMERIAQEERAYRKPLGMPVRRKWYIAAAAISVVLVSGLAALFLLRMPPTPEEIYRNYYQTAKPIMLARSAQNLPGDTFNKDLQIFANGNYAEASRRLMRYTSNPAAMFYAAIALMETGQFNQAETLLKSIANDPTNLFADQAQWYLGLCLLMNKKTDEAKGVFGKISASQSLYNDKAIEILKKLN
ncbi:MAG: tetratricopeptide repeat protein [Bacteroidales bacterium]